MKAATKLKLDDVSSKDATGNLFAFVPKELRNVGDPQTAIPRLAKDEQSVRIIEQAVQTIPTMHRLYLGDARNMSISNCGMRARSNRFSLALANEMCA